MCIWTEGNLMKNGFSRISLHYHISMTTQSFNGMSIALLNNIYIALIIVKLKIPLCTSMLKHTYFIYLEVDYSQISTERICHCFIFNFWRTLSPFRLLIQAFVYCKHERVKTSCGMLALYILFSYVTFAVGF